MPRYEYEAVDDVGKAVRGSLLAVDESALRETLAGMMLHLVKATERSGGIDIPIFRKKVKRVDVIQFTFHLKVLVGAGVPIVGALGDLGEQTENEVLKEVVQDIRRNLQSGARLSDAFGLHPAVFPELYVAVIRAGESSGNLDGSLADLVRFLTWQEELAGQVRAATYYPISVLSAVGVLIFVLFSFVFPKFLAIFATAPGFELPLPTKITIGVSEFFRDKGLYLVGAIAALFFGMKTWRKTEQGRLTTDGWTLAIPLFGDLIRAIEVSQFCHFLASLFRSGVEMTHSLVIVERVVTNRRLAGAIRSAREELIAGGSLSAALRHTGEFPPLVLRMISAGEGTGKLDETLETVSEYYDREVPQILKKTFTVLEPIIILVLAVVVLGASLSFFLALYKMMGTMQVTG